MTSPPSPRTNRLKLGRAPAHTPRALLGIATIVMIGWTVAFGLLLSPADRNQGDAVRIMYVHVPTVWTAYLAFTVTALCSASTCSARSTARLRPRRRRQRRDRRRVHGAHARHRHVVGSPHMGRVLGVGRPPHHHRTAVRQLHRLPRRARAGRQHHQRAKRSAVVGLLVVLEIPLVHWSVKLWRSLHQERRCSTPTATSTWTG